MKKFSKLLLLVVCSTFSAAAAYADNIILNGDFSNGLESWTTFTSEGPLVEASITVENGEAAITDVTGAGGEGWHLQLNQVLTVDQIASLQIGDVYTASFDARSSAEGRTLRLFFGEDGGEFRALTSSDFTLTEDMETYSVSFIASQTFDNMKFGFEMGLSNDDVYLDNVSLVFDEEGVPAAEKPATPIGFVASNMIGDQPVDWGQVFVSAGPNDVADPNLSFRLFYAIAAEAPSDPTTATEFVFGSVTADGGGNGPFGFALGGLEPGMEYTFWLYQYNTATQTFSDPAPSSAVSGGEAGSAQRPPVPVGFEAFDTIGAAPVDAGQAFLAAGPNETGGDVIYRLFYALSSAAPSDPTTATEYNFGTTAGDGDGVAAFGFVIAGLNPGTGYTFWLYQYNTDSSLFSTSPATSTVVSGGSNGNGNGNGNATEPATAASAPTEPADTVISLFSSGYTDVPVDTFRTGWSAADFQQVTIGGIPTLRYTNLDFVGIETVANTIDAGGMEYFHVDVWTPNMDVVRIKLVDFGPDGVWAGGDDTEHEIIFEGLAQGEWHSLQIPLSDFTGLQNRNNLAQFILSGTPAGAGTLFVDNMYLSGSGVTDPGLPSHYAGFPVDSRGDVYTGDFLGSINVSSAPWVYLYDLQRWVYMVEPDEDFAGAWQYFMQPDGN